ncbi:hypothetical protein IMSHALPRED_002036 [Imshaugia aleurites]|uniref:Fungal N-terminal domain-containing protein n=1 Tax=Imshaugia aleurites TaxID=172621 RepID=A0A8H3J485_9LECA|nr:hypothetical protein IMSHALPRED_002036 [Imshaugia aleurites]
MSGIEIIGLVASASQLALYSIKITTCLGEICQRVQNAPARIRHHSDQLRQLVSTAQLVQEHRLLQTAHVHAHINATLEQARTLSAILEQLTIDYSRGSIRRYWKILKATREKEIQANFDRLEKEKIALILCISVAQTDLLGQGIHKLEMAEKEARQPSVVAEEGNREFDQIHTATTAAKEQQIVPATSLRQGSNDIDVGSDQTQSEQGESNELGMSL